MGILDFLLAPVYLALIFYWASNYIKSQGVETQLQTYFIQGLALKFFCTLVFGLLYTYWWGNGTLGGDTSVYWRGGSHLFDLWLKDPSSAFFVLFSNFDDWRNNPYTFDFADKLTAEVSRNFEGSLMMKISGTIGLLTFNCYLITGFLFGLLAFLGQWKVFMTFRDKYPNIRKELAWGCLFLPDLTFWSSSIMKDTLCLGGICLFYYGINNLYYGRKIVKSLLIVLINGWLVFVLKSYIILAFMPAIFIWFYLSVLTKIKTLIFKIMTSVALLFAVAAGGFIMLDKLAEMSEKYSIEKLQETAEGFHSWHNYLAETGQVGSGYTLDFSDFSAMGMLKVAPAAINVTLFRPYIWETRNPVMFLSALQSLGMLIFLLYISYKTGFAGMFRNFLVPDVALCMIFTIILSFACGITAYNFGALVRFKIPMEPFFISGLLIMYSRMLEQETKKRAAVASQKKVRVTV